MKYFLMLMAAAGLALTGSGCVHSHSHDNLSADNAGQIMPLVIATLTGPDVLLLTNANGIEGQLTLILTATPDHPRRVTGEFFESRGRIYFQSEPESKNSAARFNIVWNTILNRGFIISDALQGIAPLSITNTFSSVQSDPAMDAIDTLDGHPVQSLMITYNGSNGQIVKDKVWEAEDINHLALRIEPVNDSELVSLTLSRIQKLVPPDSLFLPPDDFTKYPTADALLDELMARQHEVFNNDHEYRGTPGIVDQDHLHPAPQ